MKTPVILSKDYTVYLEEYAGSSFIHCDCFKWTRSIKEHLFKDFNTLMQIHRKPVFAIHEIDDKKHLKFLLMMGFVFYKEFAGHDAKLRHFYTRKYNGN